MLNKEVKSILWVLGSTLIICVGAGHGVGPFLGLQIYTILGANLNIWILPTILFSFGQFALFLALFAKKQRQPYFVGGILLCSFGIVVLIVIGSKDYHSNIPTYYTAIPFVFLVLKKVVEDLGFE